MKSTEEELKKVVSDYKPSKKSAEELESFLKASEQFEKLVDSGVISKRGNRQLSVEDAHLKQFSINRRVPDFTRI